MLSLNYKDNMDNATVSNSTPYKSGSWTSWKSAQKVCLDCIFPELCRIFIAHLRIANAVATTQILCLPSFILTAATVRLD